MSYLDRSEMDHDHQSTDTSSLAKQLIECADDAPPPYTRNDPNVGGALNRYVKSDSNTKPKKPATRTPTLPGYVRGKNGSPPLFYGNPPLGYKPDDRSGQHK